MAMDYSQFQSDLSAARSALLSHDYDTAADYALAARMDLAALGRTRHGSDEMDFSQAYLVLDRLDEQIQKARTITAHATSGPFVQVPVTYERPTTSDDYE